MFIGLNPSLRNLIIAATFTYLLTMGATFSLAIWSTAQAEQRLHRAIISYEQLAIAIGIKADIGHHLISEISRITGSKSDSQNLPDQNRVESTLKSLIQKINEEVALSDSEDEASAERAEIEVAKEIVELYSGMLHNMEREREISRTLDQANVVRTFVNNVINRDYKRIHKIVESVVIDERSEVQNVSTELNQLKSSLVSFAIIALGLITLIAMAGAITLYKALMRPLADLSKGSLAIANGNLNHSIQLNGPIELRKLAKRFNEMARKLAEQQTLLLKTNDGLEDTVRIRTQELEEKADKISNIDSTRRLFFAKIGHELRTPLTVMLGETEVALGRKDATNSIYREALQHIAANGEYLKRRLRDVMTIARSEDGQITMEQGPCQLHKIVNDTVENARAYAHSNNVSLTTELEDLPFMVHGDESWLHQGILAIIDNAIKFSPENGTVKISLTQSDGKAVLELSDQGPGVASTDLPNLFEPYFQSDSGHALGGSGLGLSVAKWVSDRHQGRISATNNISGGLCIRTELPLLTTRDHKHEEESMQ